MSKVDQRQLTRMANLFAKLADPARLRILQSLRQGPLRVGEIHRNCRLKQANTSKHLRVLREAGLVSPHREGTSVHYAISEPLIFGLCDLACGTAKQSNGKS
jgi:DNA-binding transcriptional ArsR family regulator